MYEGAFRILRALGDGRSLSSKELVHVSGESQSVVRSVIERYPRWFVQDGQELRCSERGLAALARELVARSAPDAEEATWLEAYEELAGVRRAPKRAVDQVYATTATVVRRARLLLEAGEHQRGLIFLGDDDLTSAAVQLAGAGRKVTALDVDPDVLGLLGAAAKEHGWELQTIEHDLRQPMPRPLRGRFGAVFTDPPYAVEGFSLFVSRAVQLLKPDGRVYVCFGQSRRASERGLQKQRVLGDAGLLVEAVFEGFNRYEGAESIGSQSSLWRCRMTPEAKPVVTGAVEGELYTRRSPAAPHPISSK